LEEDSRQRSKLKVWGAVALGIAVLVIGAVVFAAARDTGSSYESPLTIYEIIRRQGYECRIQPAGLGIILRDDTDTILCAPRAAPNEAASIQTFADPAEVDSEVRLAEDRVPVGDEGDTWIVGENWIVELPRSSAPASDVRGMADALGGEVFMPGAR
jgi:hypothetical protein